MGESLEILVKELIQISKGVSEGLLSIVIPPLPKEKIQWCQCSKCNKWHRPAS